MVSDTISSPYSGYFSPFPHGTSSLSVSQEYLALPDGAGGFRRSFTSSALLRIPLNDTMSCLYGIFTLYDMPFHAFPVGIVPVMLWSYNPDEAKDLVGLGYFHFARHYFGNHYCFLFLLVLRCFSSQGSLPLRDNCSSNSRVAPFGDLRIGPCVPVPVAYRSLSRPSSSLRAKASPTHPSQLSSKKRILCLGANSLQHVKDHPFSFHVRTAKAAARLN